MDLIHQWHLKQPDSNALISATRVYTWKQLELQIKDVAHQLQQQGVSQGKVIALISKNNLEAVLLYLASLRLGALCALIPPQPVVLIKQKISIIQAQFIWEPRQDKLMEGELLSVPRLSFKLMETALLPNVPVNMVDAQNFDEEQYASIVFTSGSTGVPKAVVHATKHHVASAQGLTQKFKFESQDSWLLSLPMYHVSGLSIIWRWLTKGARLVLGSGDLYKDIQQVTHASLVPLQLQRLLDSGESISLKRVLLGGSHIPLSLTESAHQKGIECWVGYGMTETASTVIAKCVDGTPTSGALLPLRKIMLKDGRIFVAGETLAAGYLDQGVITPLVNANQPWFDTKDLGQCYQQTGKPDEYIILGRADNQFISGGENIHCEEIETALLRHPDIKQAFVIPVENTRFGHRPVAFIDTVEILDSDTYQGFLLQYLDKFKCPDAYYLLPKSLMSTGIKISRSELKRYYQQISRG